ncbi:MAG: trigger factor [Burkholderiaceae bacterium]
MTTQIESTGALERKLGLSVATAEIEKQVQQRLRQLSRTVKMPGFRPGKVPMSMIERSYGAQVNAEVLGDAVTQAFGDAVREHDLRVAGQPSIEKRDDPADGEMGFTAIFEVYPEVPALEAGALEVKRASCEVGDAEIDRTIDILRKQRVQWEPADRAAQDDDRVTIDFVGRLDGEAFEGGTANDFPFVLGEGRMLADFEAGVRGKSVGDTGTFPVAFPADYTATELAGKTAEFEVTVKQVEAPRLPEVDEAFAKTLGVADGSLDTMRADIKANLEREVKQRLRARTKNSVMEALRESVAFELPKALVDNERQALIERAKADMQARGMKVDDLPIPDDMFVEQAQQRVRLGLIVAEIVKNQSLNAKPDQLRALIEEFAQAYENPAEVVRHYFSSRERLAEIEAMVIEQNVVDWVLENAKVEDESLAFDELMSGG